MRGVYGRRSMGERFTKKVSFEFRVKELRGDGWGEWRTEGWIEVSISVTLFGNSNVEYKPKVA